MEEEEDDDYMGDLSRFVESANGHQSSLSLPKRVKDKKWQPSTGVNADSFEGGRVGKQNKHGKRKNKREQLQQAEGELLSEGLKSAIPSSNIGFKMLQQMGYTPGLALGKHGQGNLEPISLDVKRSRTGLGRDDVEKEEKQKKKKLIGLQMERAKRKQEELKSDFQERKKSLWERRKLISNYHKACATLSNLEERTMLPCDLETAHVTKEIDEKEEESDSKEKDGKNGNADDSGEDSEEEEVTPEELQEVLEKLKNNFFYCLYCGYQYESQEALLLNCPGPKEEDH